MFTEDQESKLPPLKVRQKCLRILLRVCTRYWVSPAEVVAHVRRPIIDQARRDVMALMLNEGLTRNQVASAFGRDLRRTRYSAIGGLPTGTNRAKADYTQFDLLGEPLDSLKPPRRATYRHRFHEAIRILKLVEAENPTAAEWLALQDEQP